MENIKNPPNIVKGVKVSQREISQYSKVMKNWHKCREFLQTRQIKEPLIQKLMMVEMMRDEPREGILRNLLQKYNTARRIQATNEMESYIQKGKVSRVRKNQRGPRPKPSPSTQA